MPDRELRAPEEQRSDLRGETRTNAAAARLPRPVRILRRLFGQYRTMRCTVRRIQAVRFSVAAPSPGTSRCDPRLRGIQSQGLVFKLQRSEQQITSRRAKHPLLAAAALPLVRLCPLLRLVVFSDTY